MLTRYYVDQEKYDGRTYKGHQQWTYHTVTPPTLMIRKVIIHRVNK